MAAIIETVYNSGSTAYAHVRNSSGQVWNGSAFENYSAVNYANYDIALTEDGSSGYYKGTFPSASAGKYSVIIYEQSGGAPAEGDLPIGTGTIRFDGTDEESGLSTALADSVWDEARSGHTTQGTYGESHGSIVSGAAVTGTLSTTQMSTDLTEATDDHYNGRIIIWRTGALANQATDITDYDGTNKLFTFTAVTEAPSNGDQFIIV